MHVHTVANLLQGLTASVACCRPPMATETEVPMKPIGLDWTASTRKLCSGSTGGHQANERVHLSSKQLRLGAADLEGLDQLRRQICNEAHCVAQEHLTPRREHDPPQSRVQSRNEPACRGLMSGPKAGTGHPLGTAPCSCRRAQLIWSSGIVRALMGHVALGVT